MADNYHVPDFSQMLYETNSYVDDTPLALFDNSKLLYDWFQRD